MRLSRNVFLPRTDSGQRNGDSTDRPGRKPGKPAGQDHAGGVPAFDESPGYRRPPETAPLHSGKRDLRGALFIEEKGRYYQLYTGSAIA